MMKPLSTQELDLICQELNPCQGGQLQEIRFSRNCFDFGFWVQGKKQWWHLSLDVSLPVWLPMNRARLPKKSENKPIYLFLKAHALGKKLKTVTRPEKLGRVLYLTLKGLESKTNQSSLCRIEMRLFPHGQNLIVWSDDKKLSMKPVKSLEVLEDLNHLPEPTTTTCRSLHDLVSEFESVHHPPTRKTLSPEKLWAQQVTQIEKALYKVTRDLEHKRRLPWQKVGEFLVQTQDLEVPSQWAPYVNTDQTLSWNIERCFSKAKANTHKMEGTVARKDKLQKQLDDLKRSQVPTHRAPSPPPIVQVKARRMELEEGAIVWVGKNAKDNIKLLRQAQTWDIWTHLVDHPSCHGLIRRTRGMQISPVSLEAVGRWLVRHTFGPKAKNLRKDHFEMLYTECRYVFTIKGDSLGRVTYRNEKVIRFLFHES